MFADDPPQPLHQTGGDEERIFEEDGHPERYEDDEDMLQAIEAEANDPEIKAIRFELDTLNALAKENKLDAMPAQSEKLKTSFVKVYLKRG